MYIDQKYSLWNTQYTNVFILKVAKQKSNYYYTDTVFIKATSGSFSLQNNKRSIYLRTFVHSQANIFVKLSKQGYIKKRWNAIFYVYIVCCYFSLALHLYCYKYWQVIRTEIFLVWDKLEGKCNDNARAKEIHLFYYKLLRTFCQWSSSSWTIFNFLAASCSVEFFNLDIINSININILNILVLSGTEDLCSEKRLCL